MKQKAKYIKKLSKLPTTKKRKLLVQPNRINSKIRKVSNNKKVPIRRKTLKNELIFKKVPFLVSKS